MFNLILTNGIEDLKLQFKVYDTQIAKKWFTELQKTNQIYENDRFTDWGSSNVIDKLNDCIRIINNYQYIINKTAHKDITQKELNYLHKFFEDLRGEVTVGTDWFHNAPVEVQRAVENFNIHIHHLENKIRSNNKYPALVVTFTDSGRYELTDEDCKHFTFKWKSGEVYINYCHVGKTVLDIYKNNDDIAEGIRPQTHYSADFMIKFGPSTNTIIHKLRSVLIKLWLLKKNFKFKNLNIGMIPVAILTTNVNKEELLKFNRVKKVECLK